MRKALIAVVLILTLGGCADDGGGSGNGAGNGNGADATDDARSTDGADDGGAAPKVKAAEPGTVNEPIAGSYRYEYTSERTDMTRPDATPQRSDDDAELRRRVSISDDVVTVADQTTEGSAVATVERRHADDGVYELSTELETNDGSAACTYDEPILILPVPPEDREIDPQSLQGEGSICNGERIVTVEGPEDVQDADGTTWTTWKVTMATEIRSQTGVSSRNSLTAWIAPDLGLEVKVESVAEALDGEGDVAVRGESSQLLTSHPG
jgi:hypothetical protein